HAAGAAWAAQRARGAAHLAGARHGHLRAQQPLASRGGGRERRAVARPHDGPALMGAPASALGGLLRAAFDALRTRLDLAAVERAAPISWRAAPRSARTSRGASLSCVPQRRAAGRRERRERRAAARAIRSAGLRCSPGGCW